MMPVRLQFRRVKGFRLQAHSRSVNGLPAVRVMRPGGWGNCYIVGQEYEGFDGKKRIIDQATAVDLYRTYLAGAMAGGHLRQALDEELRGRNLACSCRLCPQHADRGLAIGEVCALCAPCHTMPLLELANAATA
jgi:hypothetical protein